MSVLLIAVGSYAYGFIASRLHHFVFRPHSADIPSVAIALLWPLTVPALLVGRGIWWHRERNRRLPRATARFRP